MPVKCLLLISLTIIYSKVDHFDTLGAKMDTYLIQAVSEDRSYFISYTIYQNGKTSPMYINSKRVYREELEDIVAYKYKPTKFCPEFDSLVRMHLNNK